MAATVFGRSQVVDWINVVTQYNADPAGAADSTTAISNAVTAAAAGKVPVYIPAGTYKITSALDWRVAGLQVYGDGPQNTKIVQNTANTQIIRLAGQAQKITGLKLSYASQEASANTNSIAMSFGDDTIGSCFESTFSNLAIQLAQTGMAIDPSVSVKAGLFSCGFSDIEINGYSASAIHLVGSNGLGNANCTGCHFSNVYVHNNFTGSDAGSSTWPVYFEDWDELVLSQLNIEHANVFLSDAVAFVSCGSATVNGLHLEHLELSGNPGWGHVYVSHASTVILNGMSIRFGTQTGTSYNSVVRMNGTEGPKVVLTGLNEPADGGINANHPVIDFNSAQNAVARISETAASQTTSTAINAGTGCIVSASPGENVHRSLLIAPSAAKTETFPRRFATAGSSTATSGNLCVTLIPLPAGQLVSNITMYTNSAAKTGGTHGWYVLLDSNRKVVAVTADQTDAATVWGTGSTAYTLAVGTPYTVPVAGAYYIGVMVAATGMPNFAASVTPATIINAAPPILAGVSSTAQTTPPALGTTMTAITSNTGFSYYAYVS